MGVPMMECTALWSVEKNSFSYNWAPPMSAVCKANAGYAGQGKGKTAKKDLPKRRKRTVTKEPNEVSVMGVRHGAYAYAPGRRTNNGVGLVKEHN